MPRDGLNPINKIPVLSGCDSKALGQIHCANTHTEQRQATILSFEQIGYSGRLVLVGIGVTCAARVVYGNNGSLLVLVTGVNGMKISLRLKRCEKTK